MENPSTGVNVRGTATCVTFPDEHVGLTQDPDVLAYVDQRLGLAAAAADGVAPGSCNTPDTATGVQIIAAGAAAIQAQDAAGNMAGLVPVSDVVRLEIPGAGYHRAGDIVSLSLLDGRPYTITVIPTGVGLLDLALYRAGAAGPMTATMVAGISVTAQSRVRLAGDPALNEAWQVDRFGDGSQVASMTPTRVYAPGLSEMDTQPPTATVRIEGTPGPGHPAGGYTGPVTVTLEAATRLDGADLSRIEYAFSNDRRPRVYAGPFVADPTEVAVLWAIATDQSGNQQGEPTAVRIGPDQPIKVPKDVPTIQEAINIAGVGGTIWVRADTEPYQENLVITKSLTLIGGWNADYNRATPGASIVDGQGRGRVFTVRLADPTQAVRIEGFTIVNGDASGQGSLAAGPSGDFVALDDRPAPSLPEQGTAGQPDHRSEQAARLRAHLDKLAGRGDFPGGQAGYRSALARLDRLAAQAGQIAAQVAAAQQDQPAAASGCGGGVYSENASLSFIDNVIADNLGSSQGAGAGGGACVVLAPAGGVLVRGNTFARNIASLTGEGMGGGLYIASADTAVILDNSFTENVASAGGGAGVGGGLVVENAQDVVVRDNDFTANVAATSPVLTEPAAGGGAYARRADGLTFRGNGFLNNTASLYSGGLGGGLYVYNLVGVQILDNEISQNWGVVYEDFLARGGGIGLGNLRFITITGNLVAENVGSLYTSNPKGRTDYGGGLFAVTLWDALIARNTFTGNVAALTARGVAGGLAVDVGRSGSSERLVVADNLISGNPASLGSLSGIAGGASLTAIDARIRGNRFAGNRTCASCRDASAGGLLVTGNLESTDISSGDVTVDGNLLIGNQANGTESAHGGGMTVAATENFTLTNNVIARNVGRAAGGLDMVMHWPVSEAAQGKVINNTYADNGEVGILVERWNATSAQFINNIVVSHTVGITVTEHATATLRYNLFSGNTVNIGGDGVYTHTHDVTGAPAFVDPATGDYRIRLTSAARDAGDPAGVPPAPDHDADGKPRPFGPAVDIGAHEWRGRLWFFPLVRKAVALRVGWAIGTGDDGAPVIVNTTDGGTTWTRQKSSPAWVGLDATDISAVDEQTAWAALASAPGEVRDAILRTTDGGATWINRQLPAGVMGGVKSLKGLSRTEAWAATLAGTVLHTTDGGATWAVVPHPDAPIEQVNRMDVIGANVWIADAARSGAGGAVVHTADGGATWRRELLANEGAPDSALTVHAYSPATVWGSGTRSATFYRTLNGGDRWDKAANVGGSDHLDDVCAADPDDAWGVMNGGGVDGRIWRVHIAVDGTPESHDITPAGFGGYMPGGVTCLDDRIAWAVAQQGLLDPAKPRGLIFRTTDGQNWVQAAAPTDIAYWKISMVGARR
jgi:photosystem II stability/assembly factor-like uncharacterized protein